MGSLHALPPAADAEPADLFEVDVLVIGAGRAGVQAALAAAGLGQRVLVVERRATPALPAADKALPSRSRDVLWLNGHSALELLLDRHGTVRGAGGISLAADAQAQAHDERPWRVLAGAVVMATGSGLLMAAEAGAELGGMDGDGGLRLRDTCGATTVAGLYAAGRAAWTGGTGGPPPHTAAGALFTGQQAGAAAAHQARRLGAPGAAAGLQPGLHPAGRVGLRGPGSHPINPQATCAAVQAVLAPAAQAASGPAAALRRLDALWHFLRSAAPAPSGAMRATRDAAARLAEARWRLRSLIALDSGSAQHRAIISGGLDEVWAETEAGVWRPDGDADVDDGTARVLPPPAPAARRLAAFAR